MLDRITIDSTVKVFTSFGTMLRPVHSQSGHLGGSSDPMMRAAALVGIGGQGIRGTLVLATTFDVIAQCCPRDAAGGRKLSPAESADWNLVRDCTKELVNQLAGRMKNRLSQHGITFDLRTPTAITGHGVASTALARQKPPCRFSATGGEVDVWFDVVIAPEIRKKLSEPPVASTVREGDIILFDVPDERSRAGGRGV